MEQHTPSARALWWRRIAWLVAIWAASIAALALFAYLLRLIMNAVGMTA
ncbi:DUF2474 domain-containing protein [Pollutimonas thiosulfatoxidans]|uniref:DUF2474 domain-containing protein n=1 Tax=Pollutimonas thiosulfatoxidans TaxID=2028345 RepID=A0A410GAT6_9BURK|nr:DUF2474 domain-containing protein [Pollutimonas thiosulfatoxidans]MBF6615935.1 DUF2474 domain-containing protein [Candidimonas sp.]NYT46016.1 DUF2474 domain-containing protein [Alcaligenaceae bacterium]QAA93403.1 DUF2474 domain-containing protein [Pollutimonas thiosulfatoxidans]